MSYIISRLKSEGHWNDNIKTILTSKKIKNGLPECEGNIKDCVKKADAFLKAPFSKVELMQTLGKIAK